MSVRCTEICVDDDLKGHMSKISLISGEFIFMLALNCEFESQHVNNFSVRLVYFYTFILSFEWSLSSLLNREDHRQARPSKSRNYDTGRSPVPRTQLVIPMKGNCVADESNQKAR